jgi:erythromycin esterase-like protein
MSRAALDAIRHAAVCGRFYRCLDSRRAISVIYRPDTERISHYFRAHLPEQFDAVLHIDETHALELLETWSIDEADLPETYPTAL